MTSIARTLAAVSLLALSLAAGTAHAQALRRRRPVDDERPPAAESASSAPARAFRVDFHPIGIGFVHQAAADQDQAGLRLQLGARAVFDGESGAYLDAGLQTFVSEGSGTTWHGGLDGHLVFQPFLVDVSATLEAGYLHRFVLAGHGDRGLALDLGAGATASWIGAQISPGANALVSLDGRLGAFVLGVEARGRAVAWFVSGGRAEGLGEYQVTLRIGFVFGG